MATRMATRPPTTAYLRGQAALSLAPAQIRDDAEARRRLALAEGQSDGDVAQESVVTLAELVTSTRRSSRRGTDDQKSKKERALKTKNKKRKKNAHDSDDEDDIAHAIFDQRSAPLPGQMENCAICDKRFTVTPYSVAGPDGGLLCAPCGRQAAKEQQGAPKKKPRKQTAAAAGGVGRRRALQSRILDGQVGTKSLVTLCVQTLAKNVDLADSLGDLPDHLIDKIARMFSKRRLLRPDTLPLFVQPTTESLHIYDGANLGEQDFTGIFQVCPNLRRLKIRCGIQFKDEVMDYFLTRDISLEYFYLHGANLLSEEKWHEFFAAKGEALRGLQVYYTDKHFGDESIATLTEHCPNLIRLKIENNQQVSDKGVKAMADLSKLEHLGLQLQTQTSTEAYTHTISQIGRNLQTLSLKIVPHVDDGLLKAIHEHCRSLSKLRITDSEHMTDAGFVGLFTEWANPPVQTIDLQKCRQLDSTRPRDNPDNIGLCSEGFKALMAHSGKKLRCLNIHACRHISREAFEEVFNDKATYPELQELEISFCEEVTDFILGSIFRACPSIREVNVFGCMKVKEVRVPRGVILVGVPNAQGMIMEGTLD
ncbi:UV-damaged DNA-binding protein rad7 [Neonectria magnoliae]|uniref:UV-damaged DNA-binding protein rad7 n=1 Tax=Neonectria magnoliae TaxID=2732573 RepID=A0ABR1IFG5_9HYPO